MRNLKSVTSCGWANRRPRWSPFASTILFLPRDGMLLEGRTWSRTFFWPSAKRTTRLRWNIPGVAALGIPHMLLCLLAGWTASSSGSSTACFTLGCPGHGILASLCSLRLCTGRAATGCSISRHELHGTKATHTFCLLDCGVRLNVKLTIQFQHSILAPWICCLPFC